MSMLCHHGHTQIEPPNYNFSLTSFSPYWPLESFSAIKEKGILYKKSESMSIYRYKFFHSRYVFSLFIQVDESRDLILGLHARLPQHFDHNKFHRLLIKSYGKQNKYRVIEGTAFYQWNLKNYRLDYSSTCTITCFPISISAYKVKDNSDPSDKDYRPIYEILNFTN